jgi:hypothetical protein
MPAQEKTQEYGRQQKELATSLEQLIQDQYRDERPHQPFPYISEMSSRIFSASSALMEPIFL